MAQIADTCTADQSLLSPVGFRFEVRKLPNFNPNVQSVILPGINLGTIPVPNPFSTIPLADTRLDFGALQITFLVDENMKSWEDIYNWLYGLGFPDDFSQYKDLSTTDSNNLAEDSGIFSDASLYILTNSYNLNLRMEFDQLFPTSLQGVSFNLTNSEVQTVDATATFAFRSYKLIRE